MPLTQTTLALLGDLTLHRCERMVGGPGYVQVPGAGPVLCPRPCGGKCPHVRTSCPVGTTREVTVRLRLRETAQRLVAQPEGPVVPAAFFAADATAQLLEGLRPGQN